MGRIRLRTNMGIKREDIVKIGEGFLNMDGVENVMIKISFKDGGDINYSRHKSEINKNGNK